MKLYQKQLINILYHAINGKKYKCDSGEKIEWEKIIEEAGEHDIGALVYTSIDKETLKQIDNNILCQWRISVFKSNIVEINTINCAKEVFSGLEKRGIKAIALKGLILKNFYPRPEFRTMCDLDLLIDRKDYESVKEYLTEIGYIHKEGNTPIHEEFCRGNDPDIEVHWKLINQDFYIGNKEDFEKNVWKNAKEINLYDFNFITLCDEDFLIHICMHMAVHVKYEGFGLRQLYDLALFTKVKYNDIDWAKFKDRIYRYGILTFVEGIYELCNKLFNIEVPFDNLGNINFTENHINLLLDNIFYSGTNGRSKENIDFDILYKPNNLYSKAKKFLRIVFVRRGELSERYVYAKKHMILLPVAWIHRIFRALFKKYGFINTFKYTKEALELGQKRSEILDIFKL